MKISMILSLPVVAMVVVCAGSASADVRQINTFTCRPDRTTQAADLVYDRWGITNVTQQRQYVVCPIMRDGDTPYARFFHQLTISFSYYNRNNASGASMGCSAYETDRALGTTRTFTAEGSASAPLGFGETAFVYTGYEYDGVSEIDGQISLHCVLDPGLTFYGLKTSEGPPSDGGSL